MYKVPYGKETLSFSLPPGMRVRQAVSKPVTPLSDEKGAVEKALANPVGTSPLHRLARAAIAFVLFLRTSRVRVPTICSCLLFCQS